VADAPAGSWVPGADGSGFGIENLPYGVVRHRGGRPVPAIRIGTFALDLAAVASAGLLPIPGLEPGVFAEPALNAFLGLGPRIWSDTRRRLQALLAKGSSELDPIAVPALLPLEEVRTVLPVNIGNYVDGYASIEHATNVGRLFRPEGDPLTPNWRHVPIAYHGRARTVVPSGTPVRRPWGQRPPAQPGAAPSFEPERRLDFELELGFVTGAGPSLGEPIPVRRAAEHIFGVVLVNDWSAREIQRWESQPLGPYLGKSFATSISSWIVPLEALAPVRVPGVPQRPEPLPYLRLEDPWALDIDLEATITPEASGVATRVTRTNSRGLYWSAPQQLAHATSGGATIGPGDLFASGTISGTEAGSYGCLLERSRAGREPIPLDDGGSRTFLEDGDTVTIRGYGEAARISLGELTGRVAPAGRWSGFHE
jgi:fumarylacetoacetase